MNLLLKHKGLNVKCEDESLFFYNDEMLKENVLICENTLLNEDDSVQTCISVKHFNEIDAGTWDLYWGDLLSPIQVYRIVLDIYESYRDYPLNMFLEMVDEMSVSSMSSSMQSQQKNKIDITKWIRDEFKNVR